MLLCGESPFSKRQLLLSLPLSFSLLHSPFSLLFNSPAVRTHLIGCELYHRVFRYSAFVHPFRESVPLQHLYQYLLCLPVCLYASVQTDGSHQCCRRPPFHLNVRGGSRPVIDVQILLHGSFMRCCSFRLFSPVISSPSYQYRYPLCKRYIARAYTPS